MKEAHLLTHKKPLSSRKIDSFPSQFRFRQRSRSAERVNPRKLSPDRNPVIWHLTKSALHCLVSDLVFTDIEETASPHREDPHAARATGAHATDVGSGERSLSPAGWLRRWEFLDRDHFFAVSAQ